LEGGISDLILVIVRSCSRLLSVYGDDFKQFLGNEQFISDPFWDRVIPREDEIDEIREQEERQQQHVRKRGHEHSEFVKTIEDPKEIQELSNKLLKSAKEDIEVTISNADVFRQLQEQIPGRGFHLQSLKEIAAANTTIDIKVLTPPGEEIKTVLSKLNDDPLLNIQNRYIDEVSSLHRKVILLVVDRKFSLAIKFKGGGEEYDKAESESRTASKENILEKAIESATYSTNKSTVLSYVTIFESLWKELELNEQITNIFEQLKNQDSMRREFLTTAAHELRAPIQPVLGLAQVLLSKKNVDTKEQEELLTIIIRNARRLKALTENILDLTRIESQSLKLHKETFNLDNMIGDLITDTKSQPTNEKKKVNILYDNHGQRKEEDAVNLFVEADRARLIQVISNLLNNAIKFSKTGTVLVNLEKKVNSKEVIVCINDDGPGIDSTILTKLFEKYATKSDKGIGLGLFISKTIIEAHNGRIWAENNPEGRGAAFSFSLPIN
jgi:two-component system, OmpR family, sensor histidine kinase VicK